MFACVSPFSQVYPDVTHARTHAHVSPSSSTVSGWAWPPRRCSRWRTRRCRGGCGRSPPRPRCRPSCSSPPSTSRPSRGSGRSPPAARRGWSARRGRWRPAGPCGGRCPPCSFGSRGTPGEGGREGGRRAHHHHGNPTHRESTESII